MCGEKKVLKIHLQNLFACCPSEVIMTMPSSNHKSFIKTEVSVLLSHKCWHCKPEQVSQFNNCPSSKNLLMLPPNSVNSRSSLQHFHSLYNSGHKQIQTQSKLITYIKSLFTLANLYFFLYLNLTYIYMWTHQAIFQFCIKQCKEPQGKKIPISCPHQKRPFEGP